MPETWRDLRALVRHPRPGSALESVLMPDAEVTHEAMLLRSMEWLMRSYFWDGTQPAPEPVWLTEAEESAARATKKVGQADLMTADEMLARLGHKRPDEGVSDGR